VLAALASGLLLALLFPPAGLAFLAPVALAPLVWSAAREPAWRKRFLNGWAAGTLFWGMVCYWIEFVLAHHGGMGHLGGGAAFGLFCVAKGLHLAVFSTLSGPVASRVWGAPALALLWAGLERTHGELGFTWLQLGNAGIEMSVPMRAAPVAGVYGLSSVFALLGAVLALVVMGRRWNLAWLAMLPGLWLLPAPPDVTAGTETAVLLQPNASAERGADALSPIQMAELTLRAAASQSGRPSLVVWPEMPVGLYYEQDPEFARLAQTVARRTDAVFLFGAVAMTAKREPLNSAYAVSPGGATLARYDKIRLVPFGEFIPPLFGWVSRITQEGGDFAAGREVVVFQGAGAFICYESAFADLVREFPRRGAQVLFNLSNDGYFGRSAARDQHLLLARMRAAENQRYIVRATNDGVTAVLDPAGRLVEQWPADQIQAGAVAFGRRTHLTPYTRLGDWFAWGALAIGLGLCTLGRFQASE